MDWQSVDRADVSRGRGFLTEADRRYLLGESDIDPNSHSERRARERVRNRAKNAVFDFWLLWENLEQRDRDQIFMDANDARRGGRGAMFEATAQMFAFFLDGLQVYNLMGHGKPNNDPSEVVLERALELVGGRHDYLVENAELDVDAERVPVPRLRRKLEEGAELSPERLRFLLELDEVDNEAVQEAIREMVVGDE